MLFLPRLVHASLPIFLELPAPSSEAIEVETALLLLIAGALVYLAKLLADVRSRLTLLENRLKPRTGLQGSSGVPVSNAAAAPEPIPAHVLATIAAAVHYTLRVPHRLVAIAPSQEFQAWSLEGRRQVFQSHQIR